MIKEIAVPMWDQMQFFCKRIADHQIRLVLHFDRVDEKILKEAITITVENNPIVNASFMENRNKISWKFSEHETDKIYSFLESTEPERSVHEKVVKQIDTFSGPQLTISLIRSESDVLIINCNHVISDAAGVKDFAYQLAQNYSSVAQNKTIQKQNYKPSRSLKEISKTLGIKDKISVVKTMLSNKKDAPTFRKETETNNLQNPGFKTHIINPVEFEKMKEFGQKYSATVNDVLLSVLYFTLKKILNNSNRTNRLTYTSDLRIYLDSTDYDILSNFSAIHNIDIDNAISDFVSLLKEISTITRNRKQMKYSLADFPMMALLFKTIPYKKLKGIFYKEFDKIKEGKSYASPSLTNMGIIDEKRIKFDTIVPAHAYMLGGINHPGLFQIAVSTYKKHLSISIGSYLSKKNDIFISSFIKELKTTLNNEVLMNAEAGILQE